MGRWGVLCQKPGFLGQKAGVRVLLVNQCSVEDVETESYSSKPEMHVNSREGPTMCSSNME